MAGTFAKSGRFDDETMVLASPANGSTYTIDTDDGRIHYLTPAASAAFTMAAPVKNGAAHAADDRGKKLLVVVFGNAGGAPVVTWDTVFKITWTNPAVSKYKSVAFLWNGNVWIQIGASAAVP